MFKLPPCWLGEGRDVYHNVSPARLQSMALFAVISGGKAQAVHFQVRKIIFRCREMFPGKAQVCFGCWALSVGDN